MNRSVTTSTGVVFEAKHPAAHPEHIGFVTMMLNPHSTKSAVQQLDEGYQHGGGWDNFNGFTMLPDGNMQFGDPTEIDADPPTVLLWEAKFNNEIIRVYEHAWFAVVQPDGSFEVSRMD